jgi:hypothetical protein
VRNTSAATLNDNDRLNGLIMITRQYEKPETAQTGELQPDVESPWTSDSDNS